MNNEAQTQRQWSSTPSPGQFTDFTPPTHLSPVNDADIDAFEAWEITTGSLNVVVGVLDSGIDYRHPDLHKNIWLNQAEIPSAIRSTLVDTDGDDQITFWDLNEPANWALGSSPPKNSYIQDLNSNGYIDAGDLLDDDSDWEDGIDGSTDGNALIDDLIGWNFVANNNDPLDDHLHGTHVAGTIGAMGNNEKGVAGVNWKIQMIPIKLMGDDNNVIDAVVDDAINYASDLQGAGVNIVATNNSYQMSNTTDISNAISRAESQGIFFVAAAGNDGNNVDSPIDVYPAEFTHDNIIIVAASSAKDVIWRNSLGVNLSNYGETSVDLFAPGAQILSTFPTNQTAAMASSGLTTMYETISGTSMAAPHVTGAVALLASRSPNATVAEIKTAIFNSVDSIDDPLRLDDATLTGGRLNLRAALEEMTSLPHVLDIVVSSSTANQSLHPPYHFNLADGSGEQLRTVPVGGANQISIRFNEGVVVSQSDLSLIALNKVVAEPTVSDFDEPGAINGFTATWNFSSAFSSAQYLISLSDDVENLFGVPLDGEWSSPNRLFENGTSGAVFDDAAISEFPSGNGVAGGDFNFVFTILIGDASRNNKVDINDWGALSANFGQSGKTWGQADFTGEGTVNINDQGGLNLNWNQDFMVLKILGDLHGTDYDVDNDTDDTLQDDDEDTFLALYSMGNSAADLDGVGGVTSADYDAFYEQLSFGIDLDVIV